jgi:hypothetical protein
MARPVYSLNTYVVVILLKQAQHWTGYSSCRFLTKVSEAHTVKSLMAGWSLKDEVQRIGEEPAMF